MSKVKLGEITKIITGKLDSNAAVKNGKYPFFTCAPEPLSIDEYAFDDDVILLAGNNAQGNFHITRYTGKFNAYQRTYIITVNSGYNIEYIKYSLELALNYFKKNSQGSHTKFLTRSILNDFGISDIPLYQQEITTSIIKSLDQKIQNNKKIIAELEAMAQTLYDYWFVQFDFPDAQGKPYKSSGGKMVYNPQLKRNIPEDWEVAQLSSATDCLFGFPFSTTEFNRNKVGIPVVRIRDIVNCTISTYSTEKVENKYQIEDNDILIGMDGNFHINTWKMGHAYLNQRCARIRIREDSFLSSTIIIQQIKPYISQIEATAPRTTVGHLSNSDIKSVNLILPDKKEYANTFCSIEYRVNMIVKENNELAILRDWLLPMLMNGQVSVQ